MCPRCKSPDVRPSRSKTLRDRIMKMARLFPYRCRDCNRRFYVSGFLDRKWQTEKRREQERYAHLTGAGNAKSAS